MKRRQFIQTSGLSTLGAIAGSVLLKRPQAVQAQTSNVTVEWFGHTCFLISGGGKRILVNPYRATGCTAGYKKTLPQADIVLISSQLFDEGYVEDLPGEPTILWQAGPFAVEGMMFNGIRLDHANMERFRGWRFPPNIAWAWEQGGIHFLHLGGAGEEMDIDDFILSGGIADVVMLPVGGTDAYVDGSPPFPPKGYLPEQAVKALDLLNPKIILPTHYLSEAADDSCRLKPVDDFLALVNPEEMKVVRSTTNRLSLSPSSLPKEMAEVRVLSDRPLL